MANTRHFKYINSKTGNTLYYYSYAGSGDEAKVKEELEKMKAQVATLNGVFLDTIYWEEITEKD